MIPLEPLTLKDVYDKISETKTLLEVQAFQVKALLESDGDHETRLRLLERWRYAIPSTLLLAVVAVAASVAQALASFRGK